jgi:hypothetical protein
MARYVNHPPPLECFAQVWYNATADTASVQFNYSHTSKRPNTGTEGWYLCNHSISDSPYDFCHAGVEPIGEAFNNNYRQGAIAQGLMVPATGPIPGDVQVYP